MTEKVYDVYTGVGKSKYAVFYHDGIKTHQDGSPFDDLRLFKNKTELKKFINSLIKDGYKERTFKW